MKPVWDQLIAEYKDSKTTLVADVDCTAGGESLCSEVGVQGYPSIKYGDPADLQDYQGGREFDDLKKFAEENLGPTCGPKNLDLCDDAKKAQIAEFTEMTKRCGSTELDATIEQKQKELEEREKDFSTFVEGLQKQYDEASKKKDEDIKEIKNSGLGLMKAVAAHKKLQAGGASDKQEF